MWQRIGDRHEYHVDEDTGNYTGWVREIGSCCQSHGLTGQHLCAEANVNHLKLILTRGQRISQDVLVQSMRAQKLTKQLNQSCERADRIVRGILWDPYLALLHLLRAMLAENVCTQKFLEPFQINKPFVDVTGGVLRFWWSVGEKQLVFYQSEHQTRCNFVAVVDGVRTEGSFIGPAYVDMETCLAHNDLFMIFRQKLPRQNDPTPPLGFVEYA